MATWIDGGPAGLPGGIKPNLRLRFIRFREKAEDDVGRTVFRLPKEVIGARSPIISVHPASTSRARGTLPWSRPIGVVIGDPAATCPRRGMIHHTQGSPAQLGELPAPSPAAECSVPWHARRENQQPVAENRDRRWGIEALAPRRVVCTAFWQHRRASTPSPAGSCACMQLRFSLQCMAASSCWLAGRACARRSGVAGTFPQGCTEAGQQMQHTGGRRCGGRLHARSLC